MFINNFFFSICTYTVSLLLASLCPSIYCPASDRMFTSRCLCVIIRQSRSTLKFYMCGPLSAYLLCFAFIFDNPNFFLNILFCLFIFLCLLTIFYFLLSISMVIMLELTRVNPDRNIFSINVELTSTCFYSTEVWSITITEI